MERRTESSRTFDLGDGTLTSEFFTDPLFYDDGSGVMAPIELALVPKPGTSRAQVVRAPVAIEVGPAADAAGVVSVRRGTVSVTLRPLRVDAKAATATRSPLTAGWERSRQLAPL